MFYDAFAEEYVLDLNLYAPPERYYLTLRGKDEYVDRWENENGKYLDISYTIDEYYSDKHDKKYRDTCEKNNFHPTRLKSFTLPAEKFDENVKRFGLEK